MKSRFRSPALAGVLASVMAGLAVLPFAASAERTERTSPVATRVVVRGAPPPIRFEPNLGQFTDDVRFVARAKNGVIVVEDNALVFASGGARVRMAAVGANTQTVDEPGQPLQGVTNYLLGNDPTKWTTGVPGYEQVTKRGLYDGVDLVLRESSGRFEYDFEIRPGVDPSIVSLTFDGADAVDVSDDGALTLRTPAGSIRHAPPVAYQVVDGARLQVATRFERRVDGTMGFDVSPFDPAMPLVIDPIVEFSLVFGGSEEDTLTDMKTAGDGGVVMAGWTKSYDIPLAHPIQTDPNESSLDGFITRLDASGSHLVFSTYLGGRSNDDKIFAIALDPVDAVYATGLTQSIDFPEVSPIEMKIGGYAEGFVTALAPDGSSMVYSTYLGGRGYDGCTAIGVDDTGRVTAAGHTKSTDFPRVRPMKLGVGGSQFDDTDVFVATIGPRGSVLEQASVFGGEDDDVPTHVKVWDGGIAVTGTTRSYNFPVVNAFAPTYSYPVDVFVISFVPGMRSPVFSTYLGGAGADVPVGLMRGDDGDIVVAGYTESRNFPTVNALQVDEDENYGDAFISKFRSAGSMVFSTYFGSPTYHDAPGDAEMASDGSIYLTGLTQSLDFPEVNPIQPKPESEYDAPGFLSQISAQGDRVLMSSYLTGRGTGGGFSLDESDNLWISGYAEIPGYEIRNPFDAPAYSVNFTISRIVRSSTALLLEADAADTAGQATLTTIPLVVTNTGNGTAGDLSVRIHIAEGGRLVYARGALESHVIRDGTNAGDVVIRLPALGPAEQQAVELGILVNAAPTSRLRLSAGLSTTAWLDGQPFPFANVDVDVVPQSVAPPVIVSARPMGSGETFRVRLTGSGFDSAAMIFVGDDTSPWPAVKRKGSTGILLRGGTSLQDRLPAGVPVPIRVVNPDGGEATVLVVR